MKKIRLLVLAFAAMLAGTQKMAWHRIGLEMILQI